MVKSMLANMDLHSFNPPRDLWLDVRHVGVVMFAFLLRADKSPLSHTPSSARKDSTHNRQYESDYNATLDLSRSFMVLPPQFNNDLPITSTDLSSAAQPVAPIIRPCRCYVTLKLPQRRTPPSSPFNPLVPQIRRTNLRPPRLHHPTSQSTTQHHAPTAKKKPPIPDPF